MLWLDLKVHDAIRMCDAGSWIGGKARGARVAGSAAYEHAEHLGGDAVLRDLILSLPDGREIVRAFNTPEGIWGRCGSSMITALGGRLIVPRPARLR